MFNKFAIDILAIALFIVGMIVVTTIMDYLVNNELTKTKFNKVMHEYRIISNGNYKFITISQVEKIYESNNYIEDSYK